MLLLFVLPLAAAHNWIQSASRVPFAATFFPCLPPRNNLPHTQVGRNQEFQIEWSTGHDRDVYFVLVTKNDSYQLSENDERALDDYIAKAPAGATPYSQKYWKYHRTQKGASETHALGGSVSSHYSRLVPTGDTYHIPRPQEFGPSDQPWYLYEYRAGDRQTDTWVSYDSTLYPWIKAVWRYTISSADPGEWDTALFKIPDKYTLNGGDFVIQYLWSGYYDCIDINVLPQTTPTAHPYGKPLNGTSGIAINRIDHCVFDRPFAYISFPRLIMGTSKWAASVCTETCRDTWEDGCGGVSVFPYNIWNQNYGPHWNPNKNILKTHYEQAWNASWEADPPFNMEIGIPYEDSANGAWIWRNFEMGSTGLNYIGVNETTLNTVRSFTESFQDAWVCIMVQPRYATTTSDKFTTSDDPSDPVWYSTCYEIDEVKEFIGFPVNAPFNPNIPSKYSVGRCISCQDAVNWADDAYVPKWSVATCTYCERLVPAPQPVRSWFSEAQSTAFESDSFSTCSADATAAGFSDPSDFCVIHKDYYHPLLENSGTLNIYWATSAEFRRPEQCSAFMALQPACSKWVIFGQYGCRCIRNNACCLSQMEFQTWSEDRLYESRASTPDPTCTGSQSLKSTDGKFCCLQASTGSCTNGCGTSNWPPTPGSFCRTDLISSTRKCSKAGPPCVL